MLWLSRTGRRGKDRRSESIVSKYLAQYRDTSSTRAVLPGGWARHSQFHDVSYDTRLLRWNSTSALDDGWYSISDTWQDGSSFVPIWSYRSTPQQRRPIRLDITIQHLWLDGYTFCDRCFWIARYPTAGTWWIYSTPYSFSRSTFGKTRPRDSVIPGLQICDKVTPEIITTVEQSQLWYKFQDGLSTLKRKQVT